MESPINKKNDPNLLQGTQHPPVKVVPIPKIDQTMLPQHIIHPRFLEVAYFAIHQGLEADLTNTDPNVYPFYMAYDTGKLYAYTSSGWKSVTFS